VHTHASFLDELAARCPRAKPVRLVVLEALTELFHSNKTALTMTLIERSCTLAEISTLLHTIASGYNVAVVAINEVG
ncbi:hypothetical protein, partial [Staphylococcus aureus]|uniref:hypothetical protein n=1 Tax=Staphylococcus aureus TaxID=1280 RepID=UPI003D0AA372